MKLKNYTAKIIELKLWDTEKGATPNFYSKWCFDLLKEFENSRYFYSVWDTDRWEDISRNKQVAVDYFISCLKAFLGEKINITKSSFFYDYLEILPEDVKKIKDYIYRIENQIVK